MTRKRHIWFMILAVVASVGVYADDSFVALTENRFGGGGSVGDS